MGQYLSTPVTQKETETGKNEYLEYAVSAMQGWRISMEDAHIAALDGLSDGKKNVALFGVFDGHGGREVALFCERYMARELASLESFQQGDYETALPELFHRMDNMLADERNHKELELLKSDNADAANAPHSAPPASTSDSITKVSQSAAVAVQRGAAADSSDSSGEAAAAPSGTMPLQEALVLLQKLAETSVGKGGGGAGGPNDSRDDFGAALGEQIRGLSSERQAQVCSLPDFPINAGCTSVVALIVDNVIYVANAGDSKAVLCRGGQAVPMSFEHKPDSEIETARIQKAGGFVSAVGRVNNNLNLSRSIGDLKYKMNPNVLPKDQMITAEPDVQKQVITKDDEFLFIACDGVWDVLSNEQAIEFVRNRMKAGNRSLAQVCEDVFDHCISEDPRRTSGLGGDNMTCLIVKFNHGS